MDASYSSGHTTLNLIEEESLEPFPWTDSSFRPYYLTEENIGERVTKLDLFAQKERTLYRVNTTGATKKVPGWEVDIDPALS